jgi:hypothetical protein
MFHIHDILVQILVRIGIGIGIGNGIHGFKPPTNGSRFDSGSCSFLQWPEVKVIKTLQQVEIIVLFFCLIMEGSGSRAGAVPLTRPKNIQFPCIHIRIRNTIFPSNDTILENLTSLKNTVVWLFISTLCIVL